jgi:DNA-binding IclR family transcriptional regulator
MTGNRIPDDIGRFILTSIPSVPYLEALLLLRRESAMAWTSSELARRLYLPETQTAELLQNLEAAGIAARTGAEPDLSYQYQPAPELAQMLDRVAQCYATSLRPVTDLIHSRVDRRAYQFADAFRLRKDS